MRSIIDCRLVVVALLAAAVASPGIAGPSQPELPSENFPWIRVETDNFTVFSNAETTLATHHAITLEQFWTVLARGLDGVPVRAPIPTSVYVFDYLTEAFNPYGPLSKKGRPRPSGGYVLARTEGNYVAIVERDYRYPDQMGIYHDLVHSALDAYHPELPLWVEEGLAEYYSVFQVKEGKVLVGLRVNRHIAWLRNKKMMPLAELFAVDRDSEQVDETDRRSGFYAQAWLLVHLILTEWPDGREQLFTYSDLVRDGGDPETAFATAFGATTEEVDVELKKYIRARSHHYSVSRLSSTIVGSAKVYRMPRSDTLFHLGDLLVRGRRDRPELAARHFDAALELDDGFGPAFAGKGLLAERSGEVPKAIAHYQRALALAADDEDISLIAGSGLARLAGDPAVADDDGALLAEARRALKRAAELRPDLVEPWAELGATYLSDTDNAALGIEALERAMELQPQRADIGVQLVRLYVERGSSPDAGSVIDRMEAAGVAESDLDEARDLLQGMQP